MLVHRSSAINRRQRRAKEGSGLLNTLINKLPIELHIPGYQFCGPGTKLQKRLARGDPGINELDRLCRTHDLKYLRSEDLHSRHEADKELAEKAYQWFKAPDSSVGEKVAALGIAGAMKAKTKLGMGMCNKRNSSIHKKGGALSFNEAIRRAKHGIRNKPPTNLITMAKQALSSIGTRKLATPKRRIIPIPKTGGFLPLIPLFAGLSALGALSGGAAGIVKAVNDAKAAKKQLAEQKRHNMTMEKSIGKGLYMRPYKKGMGLYLKPYKKNSQ